MATTATYFENTRNFHEIYCSLLRGLLTRKYTETNERTGSEISMLMGGVSFRLDVSDRKIPIPGVRRVYPKTAAAEVAWFLKGDKSVKWLERYAKIWSKFTEDGTDEVQASYGYRWRKHFGRDQIQLAIDALVRNPTDRRVFVSAWDPSDDGLGAANQKNVPCPVGFTFSIVDGFLNSTLLIRSSDVFVGLPYDVMGHAMLMDVITCSINNDRYLLHQDPLLPGVMTVTLAHPHLYKAHYDMANTCLQERLVDERPIMQCFDVSEVEKNPDEFVKGYRNEENACTWSKYAPRPELIL